MVHRFIAIDPAQIGEWISKKPFGNRFGHDQRRFGHVRVSAVLSAKEHHEKPFVGDSSVFLFDQVPVVVVTDPECDMHFVSKAYVLIRVTGGQVYQIGDGFGDGNGLLRVVLQPFVNGCIGEARHGKRQAKEHSVGQLHKRTDHQRPQKTFDARKQVKRRHGGNAD